MIIALIRPILFKQKTKEVLNAKDIIIALDVSYSMRADDIEPSRLERSKELIREILKVNKGDRFSLFAFTTNPLVLSPATTDHELLITALDSLKVDNILTHGTDFKTLFIRLNKIKSEVKNILLFSDGGDIKEIDIPDGLRVFAIGMATSKGGKLIDSYGKQLKDEKGNLVISKLNPYLEILANRSGGEFIDYDDFDFSLDFIKDKELNQKLKKGKIELFWIPLFIAMILFFFSFVKISKRFLLFVPFLSLDSYAGLLDWYYIKEARLSYQQASYKQAAQYFQKIEYKTMQSQLNLANSYYQADNYKEARSLYRSLKSTDPKIKKLIFFKLGNCSAKLKEYKIAREYYQKALSFGKDNDILYNLKLIDTKIQRKRKNLPALKSEDEVKNKKDKIEKDSNKDQSRGGKKSKKTGVGEKAQGLNSSAKSITKKVNPSKITRPLGYKAYELINRGYIDEKTPW
jgi:Ca-activated chloride channel family protein